MVTYLKDILDIILEFLTGDAYLKKSSGFAGLKFKRDDTDVGMQIGVGEGGTNHGIWSDTLNKWLIYGGDSDVFVDGTKITIETGRITSSSLNNVCEALEMSRSGRTATISVLNIRNAAAGYNTIYTLPTAFRPVYQAYFDIDSPQKAYRLRVFIGTDGLIRVYNYGSAISNTSTNASGVITYVCNG